MKKGRVIMLALVASMAMMACSNQKGTTESSVESSSDAQASTEEETKVSLLQYMLIRIIYGFLIRRLHCHQIFRYSTIY